VVLALRLFKLPLLIVKIVKALKTGDKQMKNERFTGKIALVTGAGRGMGRAIALTLANQGAAVLVNDVNQAAADETAREIVANGGRA